MVLVFFGRDESPFPGGRFREKAHPSIEGSKGAPVETYEQTARYAGPGSVCVRMKFWRALGGVFVFLGCLMALAGILATVAPMIENEQVKRIIESFSTRTLDPVFNAINAAILTGLHNNYLIFAIGAGLLLTGGLLRAASAGGAGAGEPPAQGEKRAARLAMPERTTSPQAEPPVRPAAPKREQSLSPFAAAAYGKALAGDSSTEIAAKYMPRSIINAPAETAAQPAAPVQETAPDDRPAEQAGSDWKLGETVYCRSCGAANPWQAAFCDQCGSRLNWPDVEKPTENRIVKDDTAFRSPASEMQSEPAVPYEQRGAGIASTPASSNLAVPALQPLMAMEPSSAFADSGAMLPTGGQTQGMDGFPELFPVNQALTAPAQGMPAAAAVMPEAVSAPVREGNAFGGTTQRAGHPRVVSTLRRVIVEPAPADGQQPVSEPARPRIVSTMGKKPR